MSLNLYQEAIVEAKQLRELAEQNAKNKIIEAVTPQIRNLIEQQLVGDVEDDEETDLIIGDDGVEEIGVEDEETIDLSNLVDPMPLPDLDAVVAAPEAPPEDKSKVSITVQGDLNMDLEEEDDDDEVLLSQEGKLHLEKFLREYSRNKSIEKRISELLYKSKKLAEAIGPVDFRKLRPIHRQVAATYYANLLKEAYNLTNRVILINESVDERLENKLLSILKEIKNMSRRRDTSVFRKLFEELAASPGLYAEQDEEALDIDVEDEEVEVEEEPAEADVPAAQDALETLATALGMEAAPVEEEEVEIEDEEVEVGEEEELNLEAILREMDDESDETDEVDENQVYEIDEASIRRELRRLKMLREQDSEVGRAAAADPFLAHDGEDEGDMVVDVNEEDLLNALADELGDPAVPTPTVESRRRKRSRRVTRSRTKRVNESRSNRNLRGRVLKAEKSATHLKRQLQEMNLFNAKLLFANKLMQNRDLSTKQQRAIVEALDKASNIREAKLLYKSLSNSLNRRSGTTLNENHRRLLGSSSKPTRSGSPAKSGAGADRWAVLAGINSNK